MLLKYRYSSLFLLVSVFATSFLSVDGREDGLSWYEIPPSTHRQSVNSQLGVNRKQPAERKWLWFGRYDDELSWMPSHISEAIKAQEKTPVPHPLRTNLWKLNVKWTGTFEGRQKDLFVQSIFVDFDTTTGRCVARRSETENKVVGIGTWKTLPNGVWFTIRLTGSDCEHIFAASLHLNPFGDHAKFIQGSILRSQPNDYGSAYDVAMKSFQRSIVPPNIHWFRPVVGTFSGRGIGNCTLHLPPPQPQPIMTYNDDDDDD